MPHSNLRVYTIARELRQDHQFQKWDFDLSNISGNISQEQAETGYHKKGLPGNDRDMDTSSADHRICYVIVGQVKGYSQD